MDIRKIYIQRKVMKDKARRNTEEAKRKGRIHAVPVIALVVANLLVLSLDYRVVEAIYKLTNNVMLAVFALFTSGAMFILWFDVLYHYLLANQTQKYISIAFSALSLISAAGFAFLDYGLSAGYGASEITKSEANILFAGMVILTVLNGAGLFAWYMWDDQVQRKSTVEKNKADDDFEADKLEDVSRMLEKAEAVLAKRQVMVNKYGEDTVSEMMALLSGVEVSLGVDLNGDGKVGNTPKRQPEAPQAPAMAAYASQAPDYLGNPQTGQGKK